MYQVFNYVEVGKCTDLIANILNILQYIEKSKLFETDEVINANYRVCVINVNLEMYFDKEFSGQDKINKSILDPNKRIQREKYKE